MARKVKAGSYWRTLQRRDDSNIVEVIKLLEDGWSHMPVLAVRVADPQQYTTYIVLDKAGYLRCKKDGEWFQSSNSKAQIQARAMWQLKGAFQMFVKALEEAEKLLPPGTPSAEFARSYFASCIQGMDNWRKKELAERQAAKLAAKLELRDRLAAATKEQAK